MKGFSIRSLFENWEYVLSLPKTLLFNFRYFPCKVAIKLPVFISHRVILKKLAGQVELARVKMGVVKIGFGDVPLFDTSRSRTVLVLSGKLVFLGKADIGPGCQLGISGELVCGDGLAITANTLISTREKIIFGRNVMISWDVTVIDHDWHGIFDDKGSLLNPPKAVHIGDDVWIGLRALIMKGCNLQPGVIVAAGTIVTGATYPSNSVIGGGAKVRVLKENVFWRR